MEQERLTLPELLNSPQVFSEIRDARSVVFSVVFWRSLFVLLSFSFRHYIVDSDYPFGIFKLLAKLFLNLKFCRPL